MSVISKTEHCLCILFLKKDYIHWLSFMCLCSGFQHWELKEKNRYPKTKIYTIEVNTGVLFQMVLAEYIILPLLPHIQPVLDKLLIYSKVTHLTYF